MARTSVLVVDDEPLVRNGLVSLLDMWGFVGTAVEDAEKALALIVGQQFDLAIVDIRLPGMSGIDLVKELRHRDPEIDVLVVTAFDMDFTYMDVVEAGAADFVVKPFESDEMRAKLTRLVNERNLRQKLVHASIRDGLTHLFNRRHFHTKLDEEVARAQRQGHDLSLLIIDVDNLKELNDRDGHANGDAALVGLAGALSNCLRQRVDAAFRIGGDEFAALLIECDLDTATQVAERFQVAWKRIGLAGCTASTGVANLQAGETGIDLMRRADDAMYRAKRAGGSRVAKIETDDTA